jgi:hypothetical protein
MPNGRCKVHGGKSTGPRTPEGLERSRRANWKHGYYSREAEAERVARGAGNTCAPLSAHVGSLGRVLINRPVLSAFGQTGDRADIAEP